MAEKIPPRDPAPSLSRYDRRLWQFFRAGIPAGETGYHVTDTVRAVTGKDPLTLEHFFTNNTKAFAVQSA